MADDKAVQKHVRELTQQAPGFEIFSLIDDLRATGEETAALRRKAFPLVEHEDLQKANARLVAAAKRITAMPNGERALSGWLSALGNTWSRGMLDNLLGPWIDAYEKLPDPARAAVDDNAVELAPVLDELRPMDLDRLMAAAGTLDRDAYGSLVRSVQHAVQFDLRSARLLVDRFGQWVPPADPGRSAFLELLPAIAPGAAELGPDGLQEISSLLAKLDTPAACEAFSDSVSHYGETSGHIVLAAARTAHRAVALGRADLCGQVTEALRPEALLENRDTRNLFPALSILSDRVADQGAELWTDAITAVLAIARRHLSSAFFAARDLPAIIAALPPDAARSYLRCFARVVEASENRVVGFCVRDLPRLFEKHGAQRARRFVDAASACGEAFGPAAAVAFIEGKTAAARELLLK